MIRWLRPKRVDPLMARYEELPRPPSPLFVVTWGAVLLALYLAVLWAAFDRLGWRLW